MKKHFLIVAVFCLSILSFGLAQAQPGHDMRNMAHPTHTNHTQHNQTTEPLGHTTYDKETQVVNQRMHEGMSFKSSGNADYDFLKGMIAHHQGAVDMAKIELKYGKHTKAKKLAQDIIKTQEKEIALMTQWMVEIEQQNGIVRLK